MLVYIIRQSISRKHFISKLNRYKKYSIFCNVTFKKPRRFTARCSKIFINEISPDWNVLCAVYNQNKIIRISLKIELIFHSLKWKRNFIQYSTLSFRYKDIKYFVMSHTLVGFTLLFIALVAIFYWHLSHYH